MRYFGKLAAVILPLMLLAALLPLNLRAIASGEGNDLQDESNRLSYELLQLRSRRNAAENEGAYLRDELHNLDARIGAAETSISDLERDLKALQDSYGLSMRTLYKMGNLTELEILLDAQELNDAWQEHAVYERLIAQDGDKMEELRAGLDELDAGKRDLKETRERRSRVVETLDVDALDAQMNQLETRLSEVNNELRAQSKNSGNSKNSGGNQNPPADWKVPAAGKVLDRIAQQPPLSDFEPTGIVMAGYTTCYGEEFDGGPTASGVIFHMYDYTCAHKTLPLGTWLLVRFKGRQVIVQVNDRGPFVAGRVLDLSLGAAQSIGLDGVQWTDFEIIVPKGS
jgi:Lytic transglycolase